MTCASFLLDICIQDYPTTVNCELAEESETLSGSHGRQKRASQYRVSRLGTKGLMTSKSRGKRTVVHSTEARASCVQNIPTGTGLSASSTQ
jgi:hypothetical protein